MKILLTTTSFQDTPGKHHSLIKEQNWDIDFMRGPLEESVLLPIIHKYDGVICGDDEYTREVIRIGREGKLKVLSKYGVGLDRIDLKAAEEYNIEVFNCPGINHTSVAEHVLALLFTFEKNIHLQYNTTKAGSWKRLIGNEIYGKTIGIIGLGSVGKELAKKCLALGMKVIGHDIKIDEEFIATNPGIRYTNKIDYVYRKSDIISLHVPHSPLTNNMINNETVDKLKENTIIINTSRGMLVDVDAIIDGLSKGKIKGYLTDVLAKEPIDNNEKLKGIENVIITPHVGSRTYENVVKQGIRAINNLKNALNISYLHKSL